MFRPQIRLGFLRIGNDCMRAAIDNTRVVLKRASVGGLTIGVPRDPECLLPDGSPNRVAEPAASIFLCSGFGLV